jgi:hypothetical protein
MKGLSYRQTLTRLRAKEAQLARLDDKAKPIRQEIERLRNLLREHD